MEPLELEHDEGIISYALKNNCSRETYDLLLKKLTDIVKNRSLFLFDKNLY
jgi:hypothetical protein